MLWGAPIEWHGDGTSPEPHEVTVTITRTPEINMANEFEFWKLPDGAWRPLQPGEVIQPGDMLETRTEGSMHERSKPIYKTINETTMIGMLRMLGMAIGTTIFDDGQWCNLEPVVYRRDGDETSKAPITRPATTENIYGQTVKEKLARHGIKVKQVPISGDKVPLSTNKPAPPSFVDRCKRVHINDALQANKDGTYRVYVNRFWVVTSEDEVLFYKGAPQGHHDRDKCMALRDRLYKDLEVMRLPTVYIHLEERES